MGVFIYIGKSLDGFIAGKNDDLQWLEDIPNPENSDFGFTAFIDRIDAIVMGRRTFETVQSFGTWIYTRPVYVVSTTLAHLPPEYDGRAQVLNLKPAQIIKELEDKGYKNLYIDGGVLIQSFLAEDLIDEMIITTVPVLLGDGIPLFANLAKQLQFRHVRTEILAGHLVKSHYARQR
jgi:dihydrofolate reductase